MSPVRILLADDHNVMRSGLRHLLQRQGLCVVAEAADGREAVRLAASHRPDVVVMDIGMPGLNGIEATRQMAGADDRIAIAILSMHSDEGYVLRALRAGARAYVLKDCAEGELVAAIKTVIKGGSYFSPKIAALLQQEHVRQLEASGGDDSYELLTPREREILQLIAEGRSNKDAANLLNLSLYTIETHRTNILRKLDLHTVPDLILYAVRKRVIG